MKTPYYVMDENVLLKRICDIKKIADGKWGLCYSIKANPFLVESLFETVDQLEVCSPGEMKICIDRKVPAFKILMSGVNKTVEDIQEAFDYGVRLFSFESIVHFERLQEVLKNSHEKVKAYIRLTSGNQFGMSVEDTEYLFEHPDPQIEIIGIHYFAGTQRKKSQHQISELEQLDAQLKLWEKKYRLSLALEYGPGLPVPLFVGDDFTDDLSPLKAIQDSLTSLKREFMVEMGRFMVYNCGSYYSQVQDIKKLNDSYVAILDGGIHHLNYYGQMMGMKVPLLESPQNEEMADYCLAGSLCTTADVLVRKVTLPKLKIGDVLVFHNCGAYSVTEGIGLFLSRKLPSVYKLSGNKWELLRDQEETYILNTRR